MSVRKEIEVDVCVGLKFIKHAKKYATRVRTQDECRTYRQFYRGQCTVREGKQRRELSREQGRAGMYGKGEERKEKKKGVSKRGKQSVRLRLSSLRLRRTVTIVWICDRDVSVPDVPGP